MFRLAFIFLFVFGLFLPQYSFAEPQRDLQEKRCKKISQLAKKIVTSEFESITIIARAPTLEKALVEAAIVAREHIYKYNVSPLLFKCLEAVAFVTEQERALLRGWGFSVESSENDKGEVKLVMQLDSTKLTQLALFNIWPMQFHNFKA